MGKISEEEKKMCLGKVKHISRTSAEYILAGKKNYGGKHGNLEIYPCKFCNHFHIGHNKQQKPTEKKERILCAAIWFDDGKKHPHQPKNIETGLVYCGWMHGCIFPQLGGTVGERHKIGLFEKEQGFLTSKNRFVGREEAGKIALACKQIDKLRHFGGKLLDSSDLY